MCRATALKLKGLLGAMCKLLWSLWKMSQTCSLVIHMHQLGVKLCFKRGGMSKDGSGSGLGRISAGFGSCGFGFEDNFLSTVFGFGFGFGIGFGFSPVDIQWISEINLELKLMFYNMLIITCLLRLLNLFKIDS
jgi:hypothetical protein